MEDITPKETTLSADQEIVQPVVFQDTPSQIVGGWNAGSGQLSQGKVQIQATTERILIGDASDPSTGVGIFLGKNGSNYEFRAGDPAGGYILWDGTNLNVTGTVITGGTIAGVPIAQVGYVATNTADAVPTGLSISSTSITIASDGSSFAQVVLTWTAIATNTFDHYQIRYKKHANTYYTYLDANTNTITIDGLVPNTSYDYGVASVNKYGTASAFSSDVMGTTAADTTAPATVTAGSATAGIQYVVIEWTHNTDSDLASYNIYRNTANDSATATLIGNCRTDYFVDGGLTGGQIYYYWVKAVDTSGNVSASFSTVVSATPRNVTSDDIVTIAGSKVLIDGVVYLSNWRHASDLTKIDGGDIYAGSVTTTQLNFTPVQSTNVIASINASAEGITINAANLSIGAATTFSSGYDPTSKTAKVGGTYDSAASGARVRIFPDANTGIQVIDDASNDAFKVIVGGTDVGDVIIGNYTGGQGIKYDKSADTTTFTGVIQAGVNSQIANIYTYDDFTAGEDITSGEAVYQLFIDDQTDYITYLNALKKSSPNTTFQGPSPFRVGGSSAGGDQELATLYFDISSLPSTQADKVLLWFKTQSTYGGADSSVSIARITVSYDHTTVTYNTYPTPSSLYGTVSITAGESNTWKSFDLTQMYNEWKAGTYSNYGVWMDDHGSLGTGTFNAFYGGETSAYADRPYLEVITQLDSGDANIGKVYKAKSDTGRTCGTFRGIARQTVTSGNTIRVQTGGALPVTSLVASPGQGTVYVSDSTAGQLVTVAPTFPMAVGKVVGSLYYIKPQFYLRKTFTGKLITGFSPLACFPTDPTIATNPTVTYRTGSVETSASHEYIVMGI